MGYASSRNQIYYDPDFYQEHKDMSQEEFNRVLKKLQKQADKAVKNPILARLVRTSCVTEN